MADKLPKVCVVIPTWNNKNDVLEALTSVLGVKKDKLGLYVCVVDNGSSDGTAPEIKKRFPQVNLIENPRNLGFVKACNIGMEWSLSQGFDFIALLNDDTRIDEYLVEGILAEHQKDPKIGAISPKVYFEMNFEYHKKYKSTELGRVIWYAGGKIDWDNVYGSNRGVDEVDSGQYNQAGETDFATGCFVMFKGEALRDVGLYDERYFAYLEDVDHSQRLKKKNWKVIYCPAGHLWHKVSRSSGIGSEMNDYFLTRNRMLFGLKYAKMRTKIALARESIKLLLNGRKWQKIGIKDFYLGRLGKGSWK